MRIVDITETVVPIKSNLRNAYIDFIQMTVSVVAVITDRVRNGRPVVGYGFNSNGGTRPRASCANASSRDCATRIPRASWTTMVV